MLRTNFARGSVSVEGHSTITIRGVSGRTTHHTGIPRFARVHGLHGKMATHGFGNRLAILAVLDALPCDILNLRTPDSVSVDSPQSCGKVGRNMTNLFWNQI